MAATTAALWKKETQPQKNISEGRKDFPISRSKKENRFKMMMIGVLRNNRNSTSRVSNRTSKNQHSSALIKKNSCSKRVKEKENRSTSNSATVRSE